MSVDAASLVKWFLQRPEWLQEAARRLLGKDRLGVGDVRDLTAICRAEVGKAKSANPEPLPISAFAKSPTQQTLRLTAISDVKGIEALNPRAPLEFGQEPLTIVYGLNGAGKSGYIRILNNVCGCKNQRKLISNVFNPLDTQSCKITFSVDGVETLLPWQPSMGRHSALACVQVYDAESGQVYIKDENEVAFEPWLLGYFQRLVDACEEVSEKLADEVAALPSRKPVFPVEWAETGGAKWYARLGASTSPEEVAHWCEWTKEQQDALEALNSRLLQKDPTEQARKLRATKLAISNLSKELTSINDKLGVDAIDALVAAKADAVVKRRAASEDAEKVFAGAPLKGVGLESWKLLWEQARIYSESVAYKDKSFPVIGEGARCVLCQQPLADETNTRLTSFESFVKGELESLAKESEEKVKSLEDSLPTVPSEDDLSTRLQAAGLGDETTAKPYMQFRAALQSRHDAFPHVVSAAGLPTAPDVGLIADLPTRIASLEAQALVFDEDAKKSDKTEVRNQTRELDSHKWLNQQKASIEAEVIRLKSIAVLEAAQKLTNTAALSSKKSDLAQEIISEAFIKRFKEELKVLGATRIQVELIQTRTAKGHVYHQVRLKNAKLKAPTSEVLSEGERRIVSLAVFLADVEGIEANTPFVFDDPVSSLDLEYEESFVARLIALAKKRQVIVFTHRLSLLVLLDDAAKRESIARSVVALQREDWGAGEPGESPLIVRTPEKVLNGLVDWVARARKILEANGKAEYDILAKAICRDTRILLERLVEDTLLNGVVRRFRRSVQTDGRILSLGKITSADCKLIDEMMTKYSRYEHSQPIEMPVAMPAPKDILEDLELLRGWLKTFKERKIP